MPPINPLRDTGPREIIRDIELRPDTIDFLQFHLKSVGAMCMLSTLPAENYLELSGGELSRADRLACNLSLADGSIKEGSALNVVNQRTGKQLSWIKDIHAGIWRVISSENKPVTNLDVENKLREINPQVIPVRLQRIGQEISDESLFWTISDNIHTAGRRLASKIFTLVDIRGDEQTFSPRHARLISTTVTDTDKHKKTTTKNLSVERWVQAEVERLEEHDGQIKRVAYPVDAGYQLINSSAGKRSETIRGQVIFQSSPSFEGLQTIAWSNDAVPSSKNFAASIMSILDDFRLHIERKSFD